MNKFTVLVLTSILITSSVSFAQYFVPPITGYALANCRDLNGDGKVTIDDLLKIANIIGSQRGEPLYNSQYDLDNDGKIDSDDISIIRNQIGGSCSTNSVYDVNSDGIVNIDDIIAIADRVGVVVGNSQFDPRYDVTNDGRIDSDDVNAAALQYSAAYTPTSQIGIESLQNVLTQLNSLKQNSENSKTTADSLVTFYESQGDSTNANKWRDISSLLGQAINNIDEIRSLIINNINNIEPVKSLIRQRLTELRVLTRDINSRLSQREAVNIVVASCADVDGSGNVAVNDITTIAQNNGKSASTYPTSGYNPKYDLNNDGKIDTGDVSIAQSLYGKQCTMDPLPTLSFNQCFDADGDGKVTITDVSVISSKAGIVEGHPFYDPAYDIDHDKNIGADDAYLASSQYGVVCAQIGVTTIATTVPATTTVPGTVSIISSCADVDGSGQVLVNDITAVANKNGAQASSYPTSGYNPRYDLNNDGKIDTLDVAVVQGQYQAVCNQLPLPTITSSCFDVNGDGLVSIADITLMNQRAGAQTGDANYNSLYDIDNDGNIWSDDIALVTSQYSKTCAQITATTTTFPPTTTTVATVGIQSLCADVDGSGLITINDIVSISNKNGAQASSYPTSGYNPRYDLNNDGKIDTLDVSVAQGQYQTVCNQLPVPSIPANKCFDVNGDGLIRVEDTLAVTQKIGAKVGDANYDASYDIDNDGNIGSDDISLVTSQYGKSCSEITATTTIATTVPVTTTTIAAMSTSSTCADMDNDNSVRVNDILIISQNNGKNALTYPTSGYNPKYDLNNDGKIDNADVIVSQGQYGSICTMSPVPTITKTCFDVTGDGLVRTDDITAVTSKTGTKAGDANYNPTYDIDNDQRIDLDDSILVQSQYFKTC